MSSPRWWVCWVRWSVMIVTFQQITLFGTGRSAHDGQRYFNGPDHDRSRSGWSPSPLTIIHSLLHSRARALIQILEEQAAGIIARLAEHRHGRAD